MTILQADRPSPAAEPLPATESLLAAEPLAALVPYRTGDRIVATAPDGTRFRARVETVRATADGQFTVVAAVTMPRRYRSHLLTSVVGADGYGPAIRPSR